MKEKIFCLPKRAITKHISEELAKNLPLYRTNASRFGGLSFANLLFSVRSNLADDNGPDTEFLNSHFTTLFERNQLFPSLEERNIIHLLNNWNSFEFLQNEGEMANKVVQYLGIFRLFASKDVRKVIDNIFEQGQNKKSSEVQEKSAISQTTENQNSPSNDKQEEIFKPNPKANTRASLTGNQISALVSLLGVKSQRGVHFSKSPLIENSIRVSNSSLGFALDLLFIDQTNKDELVKAKSAFLACTQNYQGCYFAFPNELSLIAQDFARDPLLLDPSRCLENGDFVSRIDSKRALYKLSSDKKDSVNKLLKNFKGVERDSARTEVKVSGKFSFPLSLVFHLSEFDQAFDFRFLAQTQAELLRLFARNAELSELADIFDWAQKLNFLRIAYVALESECRQGKPFSCKPRFWVPTEELFVDCDFWRETFSVKYKEEMFRLFKDIKNEGLNFSARKPFLLVANKHEAFHYLKVLGQPSLFLSMAEQSENSQDYDLLKKLAFLHALFEIEPDEKDYKDLSDGSFKELCSDVNQLKHKVNNRWLIGTGFSGKQIDNCFLLKKMRCFD